MLTKLNFSSLCATHVTDKGKYAQAYEEIFEDNRAAIRTILELGVQSGNSLHLWREMFPNAKLVGLDIQRFRHVMPDGCTVYQGGQQDKVLLSEILAKHGPFDVVVDDGSHVYEHQKISYGILGPTTTHYLIEDIPEPDFQKWESGRMFDSSLTKERLLYFKRDTHA